MESWQYIRCCGFTLQGQREGGETKVAVSLVGEITSGQRRVAWTVDAKGQISSTGGHCHHYSEERPAHRKGLEMSRKGRDYAKWSKRWKASGRKSREGH